MCGLGRDAVARVSVMVGLPCADIGHCRHRSAMMRSGDSSSTVGRPSDSQRGRAIVSELDSARSSRSPRSCEMGTEGVAGAADGQQRRTVSTLGRVRGSIGSATTRNVELGVCGMRGRVEPHTLVHHRTGLMVNDNATFGEVKDAILEKYRWQARLVLTDAIKDRLGRRDEPVTVEIHVTG